MKTKKNVDAGDLLLLLCVLLSVLFVAGLEHNGSFLALWYVHYCIQLLFTGVVAIGFGRALSEYFLLQNRRASNLLSVAGFLFLFLVNALMPIVQAQLGYKSYVIMAQMKEMPYEKILPRLSSEKPAVRSGIAKIIYHETGACVPYGDSTGSLTVFRPTEQDISKYEEYKASSDSLLVITNQLAWGSVWTQFFVAVQFAVFFIIFLLTLLLMTRKNISLLHKTISESDIA